MVLLFVAVVGKVNTEVEEEEVEVVLLIMV